MTGRIYSTHVWDGSVSIIRTDDRDYWCHARELAGLRVGDLASRSSREACALSTYKSANSVALGQGRACGSRPGPDSFLSGTRLRSIPNRRALAQ